PRCAALVRSRRSFFLVLIETDDRTFAHGRDAVVFLRFDEILAQRMTGPVFGHQDAAQIAMALEVDAYQVEDFALHPVRRLPDALDRRYPRLFARKFDLEHRAMAMAVREQMVDDLDMVLVIDAGLVRQAIHRKLRVLAQVMADFYERGRVNHGKRVGLLL